MASTWSDLAASSRWRGIVSFIRSWITPMDASHGMTPDELYPTLHAKGLELPLVVREWYLLAARFPQRDPTVWLSPQELTISEDIMWLQTDRDGVSLWGIRVADFGCVDPPVVTDTHPQLIACPAFSQFVAATIVGSVIFDYETTEPVELEAGALQMLPLHFVASCFGDIFTDGPLDSATIAVFAYPDGGEVYGKANTVAGQAVLHKMERRAH